MRTEVYHINSENENRYGMMSSMYSRGSDNSAERRRMCKVVTKAMYGSLTKKQLACMLGYINGKPQKQIAEELNLSESTVSRHIKAAKYKLHKIAYYYHS